MRATVLQNHLEKSLSAITRIISAKAQLPILGNVLIVAKKGEITLTATNLNESITLTMPTKVEEEGQITVPGKLLAEFVHLLPNKPVEIMVKNQSIHVSCENAQAEFAGIAATEFPHVPTYSGTPTVNLSIPLLDTIVSHVGFAASRGESRPHLTGLFMKFGQSDIEVVATDGFRLSLLRLPFKTKTPPEPLLLPARTIEELARLAKDFSSTKDAEVALEVLAEQNQVIFQFGNITFSSRIIEGKFPDYQKVIPQEAETTAGVSRDELLNGVKLASVFSRDSLSVITLAAGIDNVMLTSDAKELGNDKVTVEATIDGDPQEVAFNPRFLLELLQNIPTEQVNVELSGALSPVVFKKDDGDDFLHVIMPVRT